VATLDTAGTGVTIEANNDAKILLLAERPSTSRSWVTDRS